MSNFFQNMRVALSHLTANKAENLTKKTNGGSMFPKELKKHLSKDTYPIDPSSGSIVFEREKEEYKVPEEQRIQAASSYRYSGKDDRDQFIRTTDFTEYDEAGNRSVTYDNCAETARGIYKHPIFIKDGNRIHVYGIMGSDHGKAEKLFINLNGEEISLDFLGRKQFVLATLYSYSPDRERYEFVYSRIDCPASREDLIDPFVVIESDNYVTNQNCLIIVKSNKEIIRSVREDNLRWNDRLFTKDSSTMYLRQSDDVGNTVYEKYDLSVKGQIKRVYEFRINQQSYGELAETDNHYHFYCTHDTSKAMAVIYEYAKKHCMISVVPNEFFDDDTEILDIAVDKTDIESFGFLHAKCPKTGRQVYGVDPIKAVHVALDTYDYNNYIRKQMSDNEIKGHIDLFKTFQDKYKLSKEQTAQYVYDHYGPYYVLGMLEKVCAEHDIYSTYKWSTWKKKYNTIYNELVETDRAPMQWKSEADLFKLVKKNYNDAIFQYRDIQLLRGQSFDIFIPSIKTAIEYQGRQHYEPIDFFGGEKAFKQNRARDERKRKVCEENGIRLIEWKYDEPISALILKKKMGDS